MTPPKITRPVEPEVQHTFPAWYVSRSTGNLAYFSDSERCTFFNVHTMQFEYLRPAPATDETNWERLPSGTQITFTQP